MSAPEYVVIEDDEPITERYPSNPPVSSVRVVVRDEDITLASIQTRTNWRSNAAWLISIAILVALVLDLPWIQTVGIAASMVAMMLLARDS